MKRRFVIGIDGETSQDVSSILNYIDELDCAWWHWIDNFWLLTTRDNDLKVSAIRDKIKKICGKKNVVVLEVNNITWATFGPQSDDSSSKSKSFSKWIRDTWSS